MNLKSESQTLITGTYRTGSEYLSQVINCHPDISVSMYAVNILRFTFGKYDPIELKINYTRALDEIAERLQIRYEKVLDTDKILNILNNERCVTYGIMYDVIMTSLYLNSSVKHWAEKNQLLWREIPCFLEILPNAKAILIVRDPRSVLVSFKKYTYAEPPAYMGAIFNCFDAMKLGLEYKKTLPKNRFLLLRYEDLALDPQSAVKQVWEFLGLESGRKLSDCSDWKDAYGKEWFANSSFAENKEDTKFDVNSSVNRWKENISDEDLYLTELVCGSLMKEYGYELSEGTNIDWLSMLGNIFKDQKIAQYFSDWLLKSEGIQAFPTDPLKPENWRKE